MWRRAQAPVWTNTFLYEVLWGENSFKVLFKHKALEWLMTIAPIIVTPVGEKLWQLYWKRSTTQHGITLCAEFQPLLKSVWNSSGLSRSAWQDDGWCRILGAENPPRDWRPCSRGAALGSLPRSTSLLAWETRSAYTFASSRVFLSDTDPFRTDSCFTLLA